MKTDNNSPEITKIPAPAKGGLIFDLERGARRSLRNGRWIIALVVLCNVLLIVELISLGNQNQAYRLARYKQVQLSEMETRVIRLEEHGCVTPPVQTLPSIKE